LAPTLAVVVSSVLARRDARYAAPQAAAAARKADEVKEVLREATSSTTEKLDNGLRSWRIPFLRALSAAVATFKRWTASDNWLLTRT
jgi:hypothetical protein